MKRLNPSYGFAVFGAALVLLGSGCATPQYQPRLPRTGDPVTDGRLQINEGRPEDRVLWEYRTALELIRRGAYPEAAQYLDNALARVQGRYGSDQSARRSRGYFSREDAKTFLGEPYERAMAYFYRGLLYWEQGELDNARACFRSAQVEDSDANGQTYSGDYILMDYLDGLASYRIDGTGDDAFQRARESATLMVPEPYDRVGNVLLFVEYGRAPEKYATGSYREELRFRDGGSQAVEVIVRSGAASVHLGALDDLAYQATTRGGRVMDHILANKAVFKGASDAVGDAALVSGLILAQNKNTQGAGLGLAAAGLVSKLISGATTPEADTRTWDNLPKFLSFGSFRLPPGVHFLVVEFLDDTRTPIPSMTQSFSIQVNDGAQDTVVFLSPFNT